MTKPSPTAVILDTETTAAKETPERKIEVMELAYKNVHTRELFLQRYKPSRPPQWGALAVHGITMWDVEHSPPAEQSLRDSPAHITYWIGHNIDFDWRALGSPPQVKRICTLALSRALWPEMDSHTLSAMVYFVKGATPETRALLRNAHSAEADIDFCDTVLQAIMAVAKVRELDDLWELSEEARIPKKMTFGKFADQPVSAVDRGYANWYLKQPDADPYLLAAFRQHSLIR